VSATAFPSEGLEEMCCGTVELRVPMRGGVIQIGVGGDLDVGVIRVRRGPHSITVCRLDGQPIQVEVVAEGQRTLRVFDQPVSELALVRADQRWTPVCGCLGAGSLAGVKRFADVVGTLAAAKQRRAQHSHRG
jgi:hypothetical protein